MQATREQLDAVRQAARTTRLHGSRLRNIRERWRRAERTLNALPLSARWLTVCVYCHRYRDADGWAKLPPGVLERLHGECGIQVTHGACEECSEAVEVSGPPR